MPEASHRLPARSLALGFVGTVVLSVLTVGVAELEIYRVERTTSHLADVSQAATYHLGDIGEQLARLHAHVALGISESAPQFEQRTAMLNAIERDLDRSVNALDAIDAARDPEWLALRPTIQAQRHELDTAMAALRAGDAARASAIINAAATDTTRVHDGLDQLAKKHRLAVVGALRAAYDRVGDVRLLEAVLVVVFVAGTLAIWIIVMARLRRQNRQLAEYTARLESANSDLDAFAGRVAHDLRNALSPIVAGAGLLKQMPQVPPRVAERMERSSQRAVALMDALLAFSQSGQQPSAPESQDLPAAIEAVVEELAPQVARLEVAVEVGDVPAARVACSPGLLHIVLANLCGNAVKFVGGMPERRVRIDATRQGGTCTIVVADTGPGIPPDVQGRIFEPFFRVAGSRAPGTGIGLATVRRIVEMRGGSIAVESTPGAGARFIVRLPLAADARVTGQAPARNVS